MAPTLFGWQGNGRTRIPQVVAEYSGVPLTLEHVKPNTNEGMDKPAFVDASPFGKIPVFVDGEFKLTQCIAIAYYIAQLNGDKAGLLGKTPQEKAEAMQWAIFATADFFPASAAWFKPLEGMTPYNKKAVDDAEKAHVAQLAALDKVLHAKTFLAGERITVGDIAVASVLQRGLQSLYDAATRSKYPNLFRWFETVTNQAAYLKVEGGTAPQTTYRADRAEPPKAAPKAAKADKGPVAAAAAAVAGAAATAKAAVTGEAKPAKAKKPAEDDDDEAAAPAEPKAKHPCEALGAAKSFPLDEWKRQYSNNDTPDAVKWLEANLGDSGDYSFWKATYKYPSELTQVFMSSNLIGGFHNRLEGSRKYLFGSAGVYGKANDSAIQGVYMVRGNDYKPVFDVAPDAESYSFEPLDFAKDKALIQQVWSWEGELDGKAFADGKVFK